MALHVARTGGYNIERLGMDTVVLCKGSSGRVMIPSNSSSCLLDEAVNFGIYIRAGHGVENRMIAFTGRATVATFILSPKLTPAPAMRSQMCPFLGRIGYKNANVWKPHQFVFEQTRGSEHAHSGIGAHGGFRHVKATLILRRWIAKNWFGFLVRSQRYLVDRGGSGDDSVGFVLVDEHNAVVGSVDFLLEKRSTLKHYQAHEPNGQQGKEPGG
jgi:hypothetical protein